MRPCLEAGCPALVERGRCPKHSRDQEKRRGRNWPWRWVYADPRWPKVRRLALVRAGFRCQHEEAGVRCEVADEFGRGLDAHHAYPGGLQQLLLDGFDPFDDDLIVIACTSHHQMLEQADRAARRPR
ncbi:MAG TPA: hypothetical protein VG265_14200 [Gaiellaceae bacterium]|nr:hypothetical protein [Gaiellaceae bacterium]